jgi:rhodanese-related sulfurtransferase
MTEIITRTEFEAPVESGEVLVVHAPPASYYDQGHIPGAVSRVESDVFGRARRLPASKTATIVTHCSTETCDNKQAVATRLERPGDTKVRKYRVGIQDWVVAGNPTESTRVA